MPGSLRKDAKCPQCGEDLLALADLFSTRRFFQVTREFFHGKRGKYRRKPCLTFYRTYDEAQTARQELEVK